MTTSDPGTGAGARRVAVLGAGLAAGAHLRALSDAGCAVTAVATRDEAKLARVKALFPEAERRWPAEKALDGADLALVLTPPDTHLELVRAAAARGIDVLVEKPLDVDLPRAEALVAAAEEAGIGLAVCFQHRAKAAGRALRELFAAGTLGTMTGGTITVPWWRPQAYYDEPGRGTYGRDGGGVLITQAVHILDLFCWVAGPPLRVAALAGTSAAHSLEAEDVLGALLDYGDGRVVTLHASTAAFPGDEDQITVHGTAGTAVLTGTGLRLHDGSGAHVLVEPEGSATQPDTSTMPTAWHRAVLEDALNAFASGAEPLASGRSALATQRLVTAIYRAAAERAWVEVGS